MKNIPYDCDHYPDPWHCLGTCRYERKGPAVPEGAADSARLV